MTVTLDEIKTEQIKLVKMIAAFEAQANTATHLPEQLIELVPGELYAGIIVGKDGEPDYHLILLPGEGHGLDWEESLIWAKEIGGELPTRREQSLLFANLQEHFNGFYYWSGEQHENTHSAWSQYFASGNQVNLSTSLKLQARAVRGVPIEGKTK